MAWTAIPALVSTDPFDTPEYGILKGNLEYLKGDATWTAVTFAGAWADYGLGYAPTSFRRVGDFVVLRGVAKSGAGTMFTLPAGYRPPFDCDFVVQSNAAIAIVHVTDTGVVSLLSGSNVGVSLDGIRIPLV